MNDKEGFKGCGVGEMGKWRAKQDRSFNVGEVRREEVVDSVVGHVRN